MINLFAINSDFIKFLSLITGSLVWVTPLNAQIIPDNTLGNENSTVTPNQMINGIPSELIEGGAIRGGNLFHSFSEFNIQEGLGAYFANPQGIINILGRVTGNNLSEIMGTLGVLGNANLFFVNPNGIIFGENAQLDIRGSFFATTSDGFVFGNGEEFSATNPSAPPLLVDNTSGIDFSGPGRGDITVSGDLGVQPFMSATIHGGMVTLNGSVSAPGGDVAVLGETVALVEEATVDVSHGTRGGTVLIGGGWQGQGTQQTARRTYVGPDVEIKADTLTSGNGGTVVVWSDEVTGFYGNISAKGGMVSGDGGMVEVSGKKFLDFQGNVDTSALNGVPGTLLLDPENITISDDESDPSDVNDKLPEILNNDPDLVNRNITINAEKLQEQTANIILEATNNIELNVSLNFASGDSITFTADADNDGMGSFMGENQSITAPGRNIDISGVNVTVGNIDTSSNSLFVNGGAITLTAGGSITTQNLNSSQSSIGDGGAITLDAGGNIQIEEIDSSSFIGNGGIIKLTAEEGNIDTQNISSAAIATGDGGDIMFHAGGDIYTGNIDSSASFARGLEGDGGDIMFHAGGDIHTGDINSSGDRGDGGNITLDAGGNIDTKNIISLVFSLSSGGDGGAITLTAGGNIKTEDVFSFSQSELGRDGGDIKLTATNGYIEAGQIEASSNSFNEPGNGGDITLMAAENIKTEDVFSVSKSAANGKGGNISFMATNGSIMTGDVNSFSFGESFIDSSSGEDIPADVGDGGNITLSAGVNITTERLFSFSATTDESSNQSNSQNGGDISLNAGHSISVSEINSFSNAKNNTGDGGNITLEARKGNISLNTNGTDQPTLDINSFSGAERGTSGKGGHVSITTNGDLNNVSILTLSSKESGQVNLDSSSDLSLNSVEIRTNIREGEKIDFFVPVEFDSDIGEIVVELNEITPNIDGTEEIGDFLALITEGDLILNDTDIFTQTNGSEPSGDVTLISTGGSITLNNSTIDSGTIASGDAAKITLDSFDTITLNNSSINGRTTASGDAAKVEFISGGSIIFNDSSINGQTTASGDASIVTLISRDGSIIFNNSNLNSQTEGSGKAGNVSVSAGEITVETPGNFILKNGSTLSIFTAADGDAIGVTITAGGDVLLDDSRIETGVDETATGNGGSVDVIANNITLNNISTISSSTDGNGDAGTVTTRANQTLSLNKSTIETAVTETGTGNAGNINLQAESINLNNDSIISSSTAGNGNAGRVTTRANQDISLNNSTIESAVQETAMGDGGRVDINAKNIRLNNNSLISSSTAGNGDAGTVSTRANGDILIDNSRIETAVTETGTSDDIGTVEVIGDNVRLNNNSVISSSTAGDGDAGDVIIDAPHQLFLDNNSFITSAALPTAGSDAGNINIVTGSLDIFNSSGLSTSNQVLGSGGNIDISVFGNLTLDNQAFISSETQGGAGNIVINAENVLLNNESQLTTNATGEAAGGNITINTGILLGLGNSDITANSENNAGGQIIINAGGILGLQARENLTANSDITATGTVRGSIILNIDETEEGRGQIQLPQNIIDPNTLLSQNVCEQGQDSEFIIFGKGGLAITPSDFLSPHLIELDWVEPVNNPDIEGIQPNSSYRIDPDSDSLQPLQFSSCG